MLSRRDFVEEMKFSSGVKTLTDLLTSMSSTFSKQDEQGDSPAFRHFKILSSGTMLDETGSLKSAWGRF